MKTKGFAILVIAFTMLLLSVCLVSCGGSEDLKNFEFELSGTDGYAVKAYNGDRTTVKIPQMHSGLPVVEISEGAFEGNLALTSVTIPNTIVKIGKDAFRGCLNLTNVKFKEDSKLRQIGHYAFFGCEKITDISIPIHVSRIGSGAFEKCTSLTSLTIPFVGESYSLDTKNHFGYIFGASGYSDQKDCIPVTLKNVCIVGGSEIDDYAFYGCSSIESIIVPDSIEKIGAHAFSNCTQLKTITLGKHLEMIGEYAFEKCKNLQGIVIPDSIEHIGCGIFYQCNKMESITTPFLGVSQYSGSNDHVGYFFGKSNDNFNADCVPDSLKSVVITGKSDIGSSAFSDCSGLLRVELSAGVEKIFSGAFSGCPNLKTIIVDKNNFEFCNEGNCLIEIDTKTLIWGCASSVIPSDGSVTRIGENAFSGNTNLTSIQIPNSVTSIDSEAFKDCTSLTSITLPKGLTNIEYAAFKNCTKLTDILIPDSVKEIDSSAFENCEALSSVRFGENSHLQSINRHAFSGCTSLRSMVLPNSLTSIGERAFENCTKLENIALGNCLKKIGSEAFYGCTSLKSVVIPSSMTVIGARAFAGCTGLISVGIPNGVTHIDAAAFRGCTGLISVEIPRSVAYVGENAFYGCASLARISFLDADGWFCTTNSNDTGGTSVDVTDAEQNVQLFVETYKSRHWYKK